jgi:hypothetical protein
MANATPIHSASGDQDPKPVAKRVLPKAAVSVAPDETLVTTVETLKKPGLAQVQRSYEVDPAYFEQHAAEAASEGKTAFVVGNAFRVDN